MKTKGERRMRTNDDEREREEDTKEEDTQEEDRKQADKSTYVQITDKTCGDIINEHIQYMVYNRIWPDIPEITESDSESEDEIRVKAREN